MAKSQDLRNAEAMTIAVGVLSRRLMDAVLNGRPLSALSSSEQMTLSWILGAAEAITQEREKTARQMDRAAFVGNPSPEGEWELAAKAVGVSGPGAMQVAVMVAREAVNSLGMSLEDTAAADVKRIIDGLMEPHRITWRGTLPDFAADIRGVMTAAQCQQLAKRLEKMK